MHKRRRLGARALRRQSPDFGTISKAWARGTLPRRVVVVETTGQDLATDAGCEVVICAMLAVPLKQSILLDFLIGYQRGDSRKLSEEQVELYRLQKLLNARQHGKRFNWLGSGMIAQMLRHSIATEGWKPKLRETIPLEPAAKEGRDR